MIKQRISIGLLTAFAATVVVAQPSAALSLSDTIQDTTQQVEGVVQNTENQAKPHTDRLDTTQRQEVEAKRRLIEDRVAEKRAAIVEKLTGKRQEQCEKREASINEILTNRTSAAQRHLDTFQAIQDKLVAFVEKKGLDVENAAALQLIMNDKLTAAQAAVSAVSNNEFSCGDADATSPGRIVMTEIAAAKQALKDYRDAIKDYAVAVKSAANVETETTDEESR